MKQRSRTNFEYCYICESKMPKFSTTPILELTDGTWEPCCEICSDKKFPGWEKEVMNNEIKNILRFDSELMKKLSER